MHIIDTINNAPNTLLSLEILPPLKGKKITDLFSHLDKLVEFNPSWINVTYHRSETMFRKNESGNFEKVEIRKRPGTVGICAAIKNYYKIEAVPHLICGGFSKRETEDALIDLHFLGIDNVLVLRGDPPKNESQFEANKNGHNYAIQLVNQIQALNKGIYLDTDIINGSNTNFCMGIAGYPEKHIESPNLDEDVYFTKQKVEAGASYIMTQMFFDNAKYINYVEKCRQIGINVPIIPGLKPLTNKNQLHTLPKIFNIEIPYALSHELHKSKTDKEFETIGTEWLIQQSKELKKLGVPVLHYYTLGKPEVIKNVIKNIF
ncbi:MAG: methylenetetrahydrofolate reductase [Alphaproteobacteria bacterium]|nr:methylenetetrahydrofolate reductase [Alphaproteobacteria bacterium]